MTELWCEAAAFGMGCTVSEHYFSALAEPVFADVESLAWASMPQVENTVTEPLILAEPAASMISPKMMDKFSNKHVQKIIEATQDDHFSIVYHKCGSVNKHLEVISKLGAHAFHFGGEVDLSLALDLIADDRLVMGNLDPRLFITNSPTEIERLTGELMAEYSGFDNWCLATGCDLSPDASLELIDTFIRRAGSL